MQKLTPDVVTQLNNLPGFPAIPNTMPPTSERWILGDWLVECHVNPEVANAAALPLTDNRVGDVRASLADQLWFIWDGAAWQAMAGGGGAVASVTASAPIASSGGANPNISFPTWPANAAGSLSNDGAGNLSWSAAPSGSLSVGSTAIASGAVNRILFEGTGNVLQESANLTFDGSTFSVNANTDALATTVVVANSNNGTSSGQFINITSGPSGLFQFGATGTGTNYGGDIRTGGAALLIASGGYDLKYLAESANFRWYNTFNTSSHMMSLTPTGLGINTDTPTAKLDVRGTVLAQSTSNSTTAFQVQDSSAVTVLDVDTTNGRVGVGTNAPSVLLDVRGNVAGAVESRVTNASNGAGAFASLRAYGNTANVGAIVFGFGSANGNTQFQSISLNDAAAFTTDTSVANLFISTRNATAPIHIGTNSDFNGPRAIEVGANQGNVTVNPDGASGVDFIVEGDTNTDLLHVDASADAVGINTDTPTAKLDVRGTVLAQSTSNSTTAFQVQDSSAVTVLDVDTTNGRVGVGTTTPTNKLTIAGSFGPELSTTAVSPTTLDGTHHTMLCDTSGGAITVNLPAANTCFRRVYVVKNISTNGVTVQANGAETIDGANTYPLASQWDHVMIQSDGVSAWFVIG